MRRDLIRRVENRAWRSEDFSNASWGKANVTIASNDAGTLAPDGHQTADLMEASGGSAFHRVAAYVNGPSGGPGIATVNAPLTVSVFAKKREIEWILLDVWDDTDEQMRQFFNIATGTLGSLQRDAAVAGTEMQILDAGVDPAPHGWWRCWVVVRTGSDVSVGINIGVAAQDGAEVHASPGGVWIWGAQIEDNKDFVGPYVRTPGSALVIEDSPHSQRVKDGDLVRLVDSFTPAASPDYANGDAFGGLREFANAALIKGGTGQIEGLTVISSEPSILTAGTLRLYLMDRTFAPTADLATFNLVEAVALTVQATLFSGATDPTTSAFVNLGSSTIVDYKFRKPIPYVLEAETTSLFGQFSIHQAANFSAARTITASLLVRRF
ncbi:MAG: hypothetical protein V3W37_05830 [Candidatus Binatia bacterium]